MSKRQLLSILRQALLVCRNQQSKYLIIPSQEFRYCLPMFRAGQGETFKSALSKGMKGLGLPLILKGMLRFELGNDGDYSYYRGLYFAESEQIHDKEQFSFKSFEDIQTSDLSPYHKTKHIFTKDFFRENHVEKHLIPSNRKIKVDV